jgi:hypothetical protein
MHEPHDDFLDRFRRNPRPAFGRDLYERINQPMNAPSFFRRYRPALAGLVALAMLAAAFSFPAVRAAAQDFLNLFRVRSFAAITIDPARLAQVEAQLKDGKLDVEQMLGNDVEVLQDPGQPQTFDSPDAAAQAAGIRLLVPAQLPKAYRTQPEISVQGAGRVRVTAHVAELSAVLAALQITDVQVPDKLDGAQVTIDVPATVVMRYTVPANRSLELTLIQAHSPEIDLPDGVNMSELGYIGLRIAGLSAGDARHFADTIDWNSTLIVPVPANVASFSQVTVRGTQGLLITTRNDTPQTGKGDSVSAPAGGTMLLWSEGDMVYALIGTDNGVVTVAESLR